MDVSSQELANIICILHGGDAFKEVTKHSKRSPRKPNDEKYAELTMLIDQVRVLAIFTVFDNEALKRENRYLRERL